MRVTRLTLRRFPGIPRGSAKQVCGRVEGELKVEDPESSRSCRRTRDEIMSSVDGGGHGWGLDGRLGVDGYSEMNWIERNRMAKEALLNQLRELTLPMGYLKQLRGWSAGVDELSKLDHSELLVFAFLDRSWSPSDPRPLPAHPMAIVSSVHALGRESTRRRLLRSTQRPESNRGFCNENVEFLGDQLLNFEIARTLFCRSPMAPHQHLQEQAFHLRSNVHLTTQAALHLPPLPHGLHLRLRGFNAEPAQPITDQHGTIRIGKTIANLLESFIAILLLDQGFSLAQHFIHRVVLHSKPHPI
mmetsp:Transcript_6729/g.13671  ORF Transcript_6729/g.13671 Transcript_6729/m.13671 type:complete len:301 (+) Transcript_6729:2002-2904(+)